MLAARQGRHAEQVGRAQHTVHRRADLMAHVGQELRFRAAGLFGALLLLPKLRDRTCEFLRAGAHRRFEFLVVAGEFRVAALDLGEHGVEAVAERTNLVVRGARCAPGVVLADRDVVHQSLQRKHRSGHGPLHHARDQDHGGADRKGQQGADRQQAIREFDEFRAIGQQDDGAESFALSFGPGKDTFHGTGVAGGAAAKVALSLFGDDGDDSLQGGDGDDALHGGAGNDLFFTAAASDGADLYDGGPGLDKVDYGARAAPLVVTVGADGGDGEIGENDDVGDTVEALVGGAGDDTLVGSAADNEMHGGAGKDAIHGGDGADSINGEAGDDELFGDAGDDSLFGDDGTDVLDGGDGSDLLDGGGGADKFDGGDGDGDVCLVEGAEDPASCELF